MANLPTDKTNNPLGSTAPVDLAYNAAAADCLVNGEGTVPGRLGKTLITWDEAVSRLGYVVTSGFEFGQAFTIVDRNEVVLDTGTGNFYIWTLALPKVMTGAELPTDAGWLIVSDATLKSDLSSTTGSELVGSNAIDDLTVSEMVSFVWSGPAGRRFVTKENANNIAVESEWNAVNALPASGFFKAHDTIANLWFVLASRDGDPRHYDAVGDGVAQDGPALIAAIEDGDVHLHPGDEYRHQGITITGRSVFGNKLAQLTYDGVGDGITIGVGGKLEGVVVRPMLTGVSRQIVTGDTTDMKVYDNDVRNGNFNLYCDTVTHSLIVKGNLFRDAGTDNVFGNQVKRSIFSNNYMISSSGWGINFDSVAAASPDQMHGTIFEGNHIFDNFQGGIRYAGKAGDLAQHCVIVGNHIDHNQDDDNLTTNSYGIRVENTERPVIDSNLIRTQTVMGVFLDSCTVPVVVGNQFWKSTQNLTLTPKAIEAVNSGRGMFVGNGRDSSDTIVGLDDWTIVDRAEVETDVLRSRGNLYMDVFRMQFNISGGNQGNLFVNHNTTGIANRRCEWSNGANTDFLFKVIGSVEATQGFIPFTGKHIFWSSCNLNEGQAVDLIRHYAGKPQGDPQGEIVLTSSASSKICAGIVEYCCPMSDIEYIDREDGYLVMVAAVGDNSTDRLNGFRVNDEGGSIEAGDILVTSSTPGELMKADDSLPESVTRFKCMTNPEYGRCYGYFK